MGWRNPGSSTSRSVDRLSLFSSVSCGPHDDLHAVPRIIKNTPGLGSTQTSTRSTHQTTFSSHTLEGPRMTTCSQKTVGIYTVSTPLERFRIFLYTRTFFNSTYCCIRYPPQLLTMSTITHDAAYPRSHLTQSSLRSPGQGWFIFWERKFSCLWCQSYGENHSSQQPSRCNPTNVRRNTCLHLGWLAPGELSRQKDRSPIPERLGVISCDNKRNK